MDKDFILTVILDEQKDNNHNWIPLHQCLLMLFDSPINHAGHLQVYIRITDNRVIKLHREVRIPRTFKRFDQLFLNFLQGCDMPVVQTKDGPARLLQMAGKSIDRLLKDNGPKYRISNLAPRLRNPDSFVSLIESEKKVIVFIEFGPVDFNILGEGRATEYEIKTINKDNDEETYSFSRYPLSPSLTCVKLTSSFERALEVF